MNEDIVKVEPKINWTRGDEGRVYEARIITPKEKRWLSILKKIVISVVILVIALIAVFGKIAYKLLRYIYHWILEHTTGIEWVGYGFFILLPVCTFLFLMWAYRRKYPERITWLGFKKWWLENELFVLIAFPLFHAVGYFTFVAISNNWGSENWWLMHMVRNPPIIGLQLVLLIFGWMTPTGKEPLHHKLGRIGLRITPLALVIAVFWYLIPDGKPAPPQSASVLMGANAPTPAATLVSLPSLRKPLNDEAALRVMLMQKLGTTKEGLDMQWDLIRIAKRESNFKQNGPDGKVIHGEDPPKGNPADTCMFMINTVKQADVVAKHDISTLDGCVDAAIEIYRKDLKDPMHPWFLSDNNDAVHTGEKVYIGPVGHWSEKIPTGYGATILPPDGWIEVTTDKGEKYELGKPGVTGYIKPVPSLWIKIQSKTEDEVNVTVIP